MTILFIRYRSNLDVGTVDFSPTAKEILVYPNPVRGQTTVGYTLTQPAKVTLEMFDVEGRLVQSFFQQENRPSGENAAVIYIPHSLMPGIYVLRIQTESGSKSIRIVRQ